MPYNPTSWVGGVTKLGPTNLNKIEQGLVDAIPKDIVDAKGDLIVATASDIVARKGVGTDDTVFTAASGQSDGLTWKKIVNAMVDAAAAISYSKLNLTNSVQRGDMATMTRKEVPAAILSSTLTNTAWPDAATHTVDLIIIVPDDYVSGNIVFKILRRGGAITGTAVMRKTSFRLRDATAIVTIDSAVNINFTPADTNSNILTATIASAQFQAGDVLRMSIQRLGADAGDDLASTVQFDGAWIEYTGRS